MACAQRVVRCMVLRVVVCCGLPQSRIISTDSRSAEKRAQRGVSALNWLTTATRSRIERDAVCSHSAFSQERRSWPHDQLEKWCKKPTSEGLTGLSSGKDLLWRPAAWSLSTWTEDLCTLLSLTLEDWTQQYPSAPVKIHVSLGGHGTNGPPLIDAKSADDSKGEEPRNARGCQANECR